MSRFTRVRYVVLASLLCGSAAFAQKSASAINPSDSKVTLDVVVAPQPGNAVAGLQQQDFVVLDNNTPRPITSFRAVDGPDAPVEVVLVIDTINTPYQQTSYERGQIQNFLRANGGRLAHPTALAIVTESGTRMQPSFTTDGNLLSQQLEKSVLDIRSVGRSAGFHGASERFQRSVQALSLLTRQESTRPGRKIMLWVSPGWPLLPGTNPGLSARDQKRLFASIVDLSTRLREARVTLYSINPMISSDATYYQAFLKGVTKPSSVQIANLALQVIAVQSGGLALTSSNDTAAMLQQCVADTAAYYEVSFDPVPAATPDEYHKLNVQLAKTGLAARTRDGYYAQP